MVRVRIKCASVVHFNFHVFLNFFKFQYLTKIGESEKSHRVKRQCGCCPCYNRGRPCACSSSCACTPYNYPTGYGGGTVYTSYNYPAGYGSGTAYGGGSSINYNAGYGGFNFGYNSPYPYNIVCSFFCIKFNNEIDLTTITNISIRQ